MSDDIKISLNWNRNNNSKSKIDDLLESINQNKSLPVVNWKSVFIQIKQVLQYEDEYKLNCLLLLKKVVSKTNHSDFEIKVLFNDLITDLIPYVTDNDVEYICFIFSQ